jgi:hypothetical protein
MDLLEDRSEKSSILDISQGMNIHEAIEESANEV